MLPFGLGGSVITNIVIQPIAPPKPRRSPFAIVASIIRLGCVATLFS